MIRYFKNSDWGQFWVSDNCLDEKILIDRSFDITAKVGFRLGSANTYDDGFQEIFNASQSLAKKFESKGNLVKLPTSM